MQFKRTVCSGVAFVAMGVWCAGSAWAVTVPSSAASASLTDRGLEISAALHLDAPGLLSMKAGQKVEIVFPVVGRKTVVFEATTKGLDGLVYWHGSLDGSPRDRVFLKQQKDGFVGAIRFAGRETAFRQQAGGNLMAAQDTGPITGQAYTLGQATDKGVYALHGNLAGLTQAEEGAEIALPLPGGQTEVAVVTGRELDQDGLVQIQAVSRMDGTGSPTVITVGKDAVFGVVMQGGNEYQLVTRGGKTQLVDPGAAGWSRLRGPDEATVNGVAGEPLTQAALTKLLTASATTTTSTTTTSGSSLVPLAPGKIDTTITLFMTYSATYVSQWGTEAVARTRLSNLVQVANSAYSNSGTGIAFKIVGWAKVAQADATPQTVLPLIRGDSGAFKGVAALRKAVGGAITVFFAPFNTVTSSSSTCGLAYVTGGGAGGMSLFNAQLSGSLYAALNDGQSNGYYCEMLSLGHELGHNLGNAHDKLNASFAGVFSYSYGKGISGQFGTVMSYISPRVALFSSPQLVCGSIKQPCGTSTENVVATMLQTKAAVAAQGMASNASVATEGAALVAGWLVNANGTPFTGSAIVKASDSRIACQTGSTGLYVCSVPTAVTSISVSVTAAGKVASPSVGSFTVDRLSNMPVYGTRFYLSDAPKTTTTAATTAAMTTKK